MGNFLFRTANYRQARSQRKATEEINKLLREQAELLRAQAQPQAAPYGLRSADGRWWWDGAKWNPVP